MEGNALFAFDIIVHTMEFFVVIGIAASIFFVKKTKRSKNRK